MDARLSSAKRVSCGRRQSTTTACVRKTLRAIPAVVTPTSRYVMFCDRVDYAPGVVVIADAPNTVAGEDSYPSESATGPADNRHNHVPLQPIPMLCEWSWTASRIEEGPYRPNINCAHLSDRTEQAGRSCVESDHHAPT